MNTVMARACPEQCANPCCSSAFKNLTVAASRKNADNQRGTLVENCPLFSGVLPCEYAGICATARVKEFARGEMLYMEGQTVRQVMLLTSGIVKITQLGPTGTEAILRLGVPGDVLDSASLFATGSHCATAQAFRLCHALVWDAPRLQSCRGAIPRLVSEHGADSRRSPAAARRTVPGSSDRASRPAGRPPTRSTAGSNRPASKRRHRNRSFAPRTRSNDRHDTIHREPSAVSVGSPRDGKQSS